MACFDDLPDELLVAIFECFPALRQFAPLGDLDSQRRVAANRLRRATLLALCRTSERCKGIAEPHLFSDIVVDDSTTRACQRLDRLLRTIIAKPNLAAIIQYIEYVQCPIEMSAERRSRPYERATDWVASTIFSAFEASVFTADSYGDRLAVSQVTLVLFLSPNITHLACSFRTEQAWMETPLLLRALGFRSNLFPEHSEFPPLTSVERLCLLSNDPDELKLSCERNSVAIPGRFALETMTRIPHLRHLSQRGVQYGIRASCNFETLHTLSFQDTLIPIEKVMTAVLQCPNLRTFEYSMGSGDPEHNPIFDVAALPQALIQCKDTLKPLSLVYTDGIYDSKICPITSLQHLHTLETLTISICLLWVPFDHFCMLIDHLPASIEAVNVLLQTDTRMRGQLPRLNALLEHFIDEIPQFPRLKAIRCVDLTSA